jgi:serine/threonine protein kinase
MTAIDSYSNPSFVFQELVGSGTFGNVYKAYDTISCQNVAIKRTIKKGCIVSREFKILLEVKECEYCIKILDIFYTINNNHDLIQHLVFEYMPISLGNVIRANLKMSYRMNHEEIICISKQLLQGLSFIHSRSIIHRDIKPDNVLITLDFPYKVKICDFGSAKKIGDASTPYIVSRFYRAPELIFCFSRYGTSVDVWAAGCLILELYMGFPVFRGNSDGDQFIQIARVLGPPTKDDIKVLATNKLSAKILSKATAVGKKQNILDLLTISPNPKLVEDLISKMLAWDPNKRLTAEECLLHDFFKV